VRQEQITAVVDRIHHRLVARVLRLAAFTRTGAQAESDE
jgi:hypothetical protein